MNRLHKPGLLRQKLIRRSVLLGAVQGVLVFGLGVQMHRIMAGQNRFFRLLAEENRLNIRLIPPVRGLVFDRLGQPVAYNGPNYKIDMVREQAKNPETVLRRLQTLVPISDEDIATALEKMQKYRGFVPITVAQNLDWQHIAAVSINSPALPGITTELGHHRIYPQAKDFAHIVGYVGPVSDHDFKNRNDDDPLLLIPQFQIGKTGVERRIDVPLRGKAGVEQIEVNSIGRVMRVLKREEPDPGANVQLTIDNRLQAYAFERLGNESGSAVVMDLRNGDLVALVSAPTFDPNKFVHGISVTDWTEINENKYKPMLNKAITGTYPPGSTYKMVTALAALRHGIVDKGTSHRCNGFVEVFGRRFHCWNRRGHGRVALHTSLKESCDVYYYKVSQELGIERMSAMARELGLGVSHELDLPAVRSGLVPTKSWKKETHDRNWVVGDTINASIGQGFVLSSPVQLAVMTARIATGTKISPRLINAIDNRPQPVKGREPINIEPDHLETVRKAMWAVVNERGGTAGGSRLHRRDVEMAGKTGTSQVRYITREERERGVFRNEDLPWERRDHALFIGYAPADSPRFAVSVVVEHGGSGSKKAAPVARDILQKALNLAPDMNYRTVPNRKTAERASEKA
ncbi:MAG: penicillin-binding protein 2 [Rhodobacteraceae bacterium]|nr:penicillin-binding protein 2 [Paracoccaceae bacterium]